MKLDRQVELLSRPIRYAYVIGAKPTKKEIIKVIMNCCESFGGFHNIIIPSNGETLDDWWGRFLIAGDPDVILLYGRFNNIEAIKSQIAQIDIQPFKVKVWRGELASTERVVKYSPLPIDKLYMAKIAEATQYGVGKKLNIVVTPRRGKNIDLIDYFDFGILPRSYIAEYKNAINFISSNKIRRPIIYPVSDPTDITKENITHAEWEYFNTCYNESILGPYVAVTGDDNSLEDCCLFWNWRALSSRWVFVRWVSKADIDNIFKGTIFNPAVLDLPIHAKLLTSISIGLSNSRTARNLLSHIPNYSQNVSKVGFSYKHPSEYDRELASAKYFCRRDTVSLSDEGSLLINRVMPPPYSYDDCLFKDLIFDLEVKAKAVNEKSGMKMSPRHICKDVLTLENGELETDVRISRRNFTILLPCALSTKSVSVRFNSDWEIISNICRRGGVRIAESPSGKHIRRALELAGSIEELASYYRSRIAREILNAFLTRHAPSIALSKRRRELYRRSFSVNDLRETVVRSLNITSAYQKKKTENEIDRLTNIWWRKGILTSGFELSCEECNFETWYPIEIVGDRFICWRCQLENLRPHDSEIHYKLQESFYQAHWENMIVPILTLDYIKNNVAEESFLYSVPVSLEPNNPSSSDIDLVAIVDGEVVIAECKIPNKLDNKVFRRYDEIARKTMAHRIVFSTINRKNTCENKDCKECTKLVGVYSDETFSHGVPSNPKQWGTREKIKDFRGKMAEDGISVTTLCSEDLGFVEI